MSFHVTIFLFFTFLGFLLAIFFFLKKQGNKFSNRLLGFYTLFFSLEMLHGCLQWAGFLVVPNFTHFALTNALLWMSYGPLVYFYVRKAVTNEGLKSGDLRWFIPTGIIFMLHAPFYFNTTTEKIAIIENGEIYSHAIFPSYAIWIVIAVMVFYAVFTYMKFKNNREVGYKETIWLKWFISMYGGFVAAFAMYIFLVRFGIMDAKYDYFVDAIIAVFITSLAYFGFIQPEVFHGVKPLKKLVPFVKYRKTGLTERLSHELKLKLDQLMESEKPYLNHDVRLNDIASLLNVSRNHASQIINENYNLSFFDFMNKQRVNEATRLLLNNEEVKLNITQIAYSSGFNSRASFYKAFKKFTNSSPSSYIQHSSAS